MGFFAKSAQNASLIEKWAKSARWSLLVLPVFYLGTLPGNSLVAQTTLSDAERLFNATIVNVQTLNTIKAEVRMEVFVLGKEYTAKGTYEEQRLENPPPGDFQRSMYRLDLHFVTGTPMAPGSEPNRLIILCHPTSDREAGRL